MASQDQNIDGSSIEHSSVQLAQAGQNAVSFQNSHDNQVTINTIIWRLFGRGESSSVDWNWAQRLLKDKQLPDIRKRLTDMLGRDRTLMQISLEEQLSWVGRSPLQANQRLQVKGEDQGILDWQQMLIETFGREDVGGKLLILGTPGAGKTTALLSLAEQLVCGAIAQPKTVIPVIFELSTWREGKSIEDWLIEQLYDLHGGDRKAKRYEQWLEPQVLLPLMDGLDELGLEQQKQCTLKLNEFARHYPQLVVCCRVKEFAQANIKLDLRGSVCLEPLSDEQIQDYLKRIDQLQLWLTIQATPVLQALLEPDEEGDPGLLRVPLFLTLVASVYDAQYPFQTKEELLDQYVDRQLSLDVRQSDRRKETDRKQWAYPTPTQEPDRRQTQRTLQWIAQQLQKDNAVELLIERIQPRWLETQSIQWRYRLMFGLVFGLFSVLVFGPIVGLVFGLMIGPIFGLFGVLDNSIRPVETFRISISRVIRHKILRSLKRSLIFGLMIGSILGLILVLNYGLSYGLIIGLIIWLILMLNYGLITGLIIWLIVGLFGLFSELLSGLKQDLQLRSYPNQGIWKSFQNLLWTTALIYLISIFPSVIIEFHTIIEQNTNPRERSLEILNLLWKDLPHILLPKAVLLVLLFSFLWGGGQACIQHLCLRFVLWQSGVAPWNLARFLNYCVERRLLQRVGGRYRFLHRELLDHFASQNPV